jgi:hypothetical protein
MFLAFLGGYHSPTKHYSYIIHVLLWKKRTYSNLFLVSLLVLIQNLGCHENGVILPAVRQCERVKDAAVLTATGQRPQLPALPH